MNSRERNDLIISWLTLSVAFALVISDNFLNLMSLAEALPIALVAVGTGFVAHEMAHRQMARRYGFHAEYRAWPGGLAFAVLLAFISGGRFIFAAPGATYIFASTISREQNGKISIAGPVTNIIIGIILLIGAPMLLASMLIFGLTFDPLVFSILINAAFINFWFAFFNLLPFGPLDGTKVIAWNSAIWLVTIAIAAALAFLPDVLSVFFQL